MDMAEAAAQPSKVGKINLLENKQQFQIQNVINNTTSVEHSLTKGLDSNS
jgi:hypothetical protein